MIFLIVMLLGLAVWMLLRGKSLQQDAGLPPGRILYSDPQLIGPPPKPFFDATTMLTGKPDYLVKEGDALIPVEVKSGYAPAEPYAGHVLQLLAYCYLVEQDSGQRPPYGILRYRNRTFAIDYTAEQEATLLDLLAEMREDFRMGELERSHSDSGRCARCGFRDACDQRL